MLGKWEAMPPHLWELSLKERMNQCPFTKFILTLLIIIFDSEFCDIFLLFVTAFFLVIKCFIVCPFIAQGRGDTSGGCKCGLNRKKCHPNCRNCH